MEREKVTITATGEMSLYQRDEVISWLGSQGLSTEVKVVNLEEEVLQSGVTLKDLNEFAINNGLHTWSATRLFHIIIERCPNLLDEDGAINTRKLAVAIDNEQLQRHTGTKTTSFAQLFLAGQEQTPEDFLEKYEDQLDLLKDHDSHRALTKQAVGISIGNAIEEVPNYSIGELELSVRAWNLLTSENIGTVRELGNYSLDRLLSISGLGRKTLDEILEAMDEQGWLTSELSKGTPPENRLYEYRKKDDYYIPKPYG